MTTQLSSEHLGLPPPLELDLVDAGRTVGWIASDTVGFHGFAGEEEAAHAAWVAHRTLARQIARTHGGRPVPVDTEPLSLQRSGERELILASGRPIATLVRPGAEDASGPDSVGFEIRIPDPADELRVRSLAYLMYRTLRKSGIRWALWRVGSTPARSAADSTEANAGRVRRGGGTRQAAGSANGTGNVIEFPWWRATRPTSRVTPAPSAFTFMSTIILITLAVTMVAALLAFAPRMLMISLAAMIVTGLSAAAVVRLGRWRFSSWPRWPRTPARPQADERARVHQLPLPSSDARWGVLGGVSVLLLVLASLSSDGLRVAFAATGLLGLLVLRLAAMHGRWIRRGSVLLREPAASSYHAGEIDYETSSGGAQR